MQTADGRRDLHETQEADRGRRYHRLPRVGCSQELHRSGGGGTGAHARVERLTQALREQAEGWRFAPLVRALMTLKGIDFVAAITLVAELGDLARFSHPKELMSYLGLVPSEYSTGESRSQGKITKAGNAQVRRLLIESAWSYRYPPRMSRERIVRCESQPKAIRDLAWKAQLRLCGRYRKLSARGVHQNKVCVAIARELAAFVWDVARHVPVAR